MADSYGDSHVMCTLMAKLVAALWMWPSWFPHCCAWPSLRIGVLSEGTAGFVCLGYRSVQETWPGRCVESKCKRLEWSSLNFRTILRIVEIIMD